MRNPRIFVLIALFSALGCGGSTTPPADDVESAPARDGVMEAPADGSMHPGGGINAEIALDPEVADDWQAIRVRVVELETMNEAFYEVPVGGAAPLGDTGLTLEVLVFLPDFVMGEGGITSRSAEPQNPAARVVIMEEGKDDYEGWLFGAMPEIHAYPHELYGVMLAEGVPAE